MSPDINSILLALTVSTLTMAVALPSVMGIVSAAAKQAQLGIALQAAGWVFLLLSGAVDANSWNDRALSTLAMAGIAGGLAFNAIAFHIWCGRATHPAAPAIIAVVMPLGYCIGFSSYAFRVGWANGLLALQMALIAATLGRKPELPVGRWRWLLVATLLVQVIFTAWRGVLGAFFTADYPEFLAPHRVNVAFALIANATAVLSLICILLAHRDEASRALERLAQMDGLTGVFNRRTWFLRAETELAISLRYDHPFTVLMIDLDHFKLINDLRGHEAGDRALQFVARALQAAVRPGDLVGRYGGEEFCVLMNHGDLEAARAFDQRMRAYLSEVAVDELGFALSYSAGIAMRKTPTDTLAALLSKADAMLYNAKAQGRARTLHSQQMGLHSR